MRKTITSWNELCKFIKTYKDKNQSITLKPVSWNGWKRKRQKDKKVYLMK